MNIVIVNPQAFIAITIVRNIETIIQNLLHIFARKNLGIIDTPRLTLAEDMGLESDLKPLTR